MNASLKRLGARLERIGMAIAPFGDHVAVRLPLFCHVRVRIVGGRLQCEPYTGAVPRMRATVLLFGMFGAFLWTSFARHGINAEGMGLGFLAVLAVALETIRYVLTESAIGRVQAAVLAEPWLLDAMPADVGAGTAPAALDAGMGAAAEVQMRDRDAVR